MSTDLETNGAGSVVAQAVTHLSGSGVVIPPSWKGIIGRHARTLLQGGFDEDTCAMAAILAIRRGSPQLMQYIAGDIALARSGAHLDRKAYERQLADMREIA